MAEDNNDFGLAAIGKSLLDGIGLTRKRQEEEVKQLARKKQAAAEQRRITESSARISQNLVDNIGGFVSAIDDAEKGKAEIDALRADGSLASSLEIIGKQIRDPGKYTRDGRTRRVAEANQLINARTQTAALQQSALADLSKVVDAKLVEQGSDLESATLREQQNAQLVEAEMTRVQAMANTLMTNNSLQQQKLAMMSEADIIAASQKSNGQPIDVGGVMLSPGQLETRIRDINERKYQEQAREALAAQKNDAAAKIANQKILQTMNVEELRPLLLSGDPRFDIADIKQVYDTKMSAQADEVARMGLEFQYQDFNAGVTVPAMEDAQRMTPAIPKNTPLASALDVYKQTIGTVMSTTKIWTDQGAEIPIEVRQTGAKAVTSAREDLDKAIAKEAKLRSGGNKNLEQIYSEIYRGNEAPRDVVETYVTEQLDKNEPLTAVLPADVATAVQSRFNDLYSNAIKQGLITPGFDKKQAKAEAIQQAIAEGVGAKITERTDDLFVGQLQDPSNPLYGSVNPNQLRRLVATADAEGAQEFMTKYGLTPDEFTMFTSGNPVEGKVGPEAATELSIIQTQALFLQLDSIESGLANRYAKWWETNGQAYANQTAKRRYQESLQAGPQAMTMESFAGPIERRQQGAMMQVVSDAEMTYGQAKERRYNEMISFDLNPAHRQATLLQFNKELSDAEKTQFMRGFILPIIKEGQNQGLQFEQINTLVENAIDAGQAQDPTIQKILKKVAKDRVATVDLMESAMVQPHWRVAAGEPRMGFQPQAWLRRTTAQRKYDWYRESLGE